jgi:hypothetical protein
MNRSTRNVVPGKHVYTRRKDTTCGLCMKISVLQVLHQCMLQQVLQK